MLFLIAARDRVKNGVPPCLRLLKSFNIYSYVKKDAGAAAYTIPHESGL